MILVSGAGGKTGRAVMKALVEKGQSVRGFLRRKHPISQIGRLEIDQFIGDMTDADDWAAACEGVEKIYHICPNMHQGEVDIGRIALTAAKQANIKHFVYHSVLHPQTELMPHHWRKNQVEALIFKSGIPFTILQPTAYMENTLNNFLDIVRRYEFRVPYPVGTATSLIHLGDVAEVAAMVLTKKGHTGATYELVGQKAIPQTAIAAMYSSRLNQVITAVEVSHAEWIQEANSRGVNPAVIRGLLSMFDYYKQYGLVGNPRVCTLLLGRRPTQFEEFLAKLQIGS